ncbi:PdxA family dehydrogenase [Actinomycetospora soli]|uniref:PdxA family dehydrogenase n=1 Tax=Actinomycetospora soli TaxID=2893887 RepID=UPI001E2EB8D3|nr:4-hydroxythreonine-4-phosphate dehydrogenase PdxA [Actinomycetospora soli]MCD2191575.1 4-hydroxythreonine-4-phosphate dehydrogenase PdxA [Actinomycetospora soli]
MTGRVLLATGDPTGVGPELAAAAVAALGNASPLVVGPVGPLREAARRFDLTVHETDGTVEAAPGVLDVVPVGVVEPLRPGAPGAASGAATVASVERCLALVDAGVGRAIVACPHSETAVAAAGVDFAGYPALLADLRGLRRDRVFLMLVGGGLRIVHTTLHERLAGALDRLDADTVAAAIRAGHGALRELGIRRPRLCTFGINPHAGEGGLFGSDDETVTAPAVATARGEGLEVDGPTGADVVLAGPDRERYDAFVAMYHDQGHLPVKLLAGRAASALAIGAGVMFSSVGHGAAFDIAGTGTADVEPTLRALRLVSGPTITEVPA